MEKWTLSDKLGVLGIVVSVVLGLFFALLTEESRQTLFLLLNSSLLLYIIVFGLSIWVYILIKKNEKLEHRYPLIKSIIGIPLDELEKYLFVSDQKPKNFCYVNNFILSMNIIYGELSRQDVEYLWEFEGYNDRNEVLNYLYLAIGGDNSINSYEDIKLEVYDLLGESQTAYKPRFRPGSITPTSAILEIPFTGSSISKNERFHIRLKYIWPLNYNRNTDYFFVDIGHFASKVEKAEIRINFTNNIISQSELVVLKRDSNGKYDISDRYIKIPTAQNGLERVTHFINNIEDTKFYLVQTRK